MIFTVDIVCRAGAVVGSVRHERGCAELKKEEKQKERKDARGTRASGPQYESRAPSQVAITMRKTIVRSHSPLSFPVAKLPIEFPAEARTLFQREDYKNGRGGRTGGQHESNGVDKKLPT